MKKQKNLPIEIKIFVSEDFHERLEELNRAIDRQAMQIATALINANPQIFGQAVQPKYLEDATCFYNAKSPHLQCAIAPSQDCQTCPHHSKYKNTPSTSGDVDEVAHG